MRREVGGRVAERSEYQHAVREFLGNRKCGQVDVRDCRFVDVIRFMGIGEIVRRQGAEFLMA